MDHLIDDAAHWRDRANKIRALAEDVEDHDARVSMLRNADDYDNLARRARKRMNGSSPSGACFTTLYGLAPSIGCGEALKNRR